jgi:hypothetical protein
MTAELELNSDRENPRWCAPTVQPGKPLPASREVREIAWNAQFSGRNSRLKSHTPDTGIPVERSLACDGSGISVSPQLDNMT